MVYFKIALAVDVSATKKFLCIDLQEQFCNWKLTSASLYEKTFHLSNCVELHHIEFSSSLRHFVIIGKMYVGSNMFYILFDLLHNEVYLVGNECRNKPFISLYNRIKGKVDYSLRSCVQENIQSKDFNLSLLPIPNYISSSGSNKEKNLAAFLRKYSIKMDQPVQRTIDRKKKTRDGMVSLSENEKLGYGFDQDMLSALGRRSKAVEKFQSRQGITDIGYNYGIKIDVDVIDPSTIQGGVFEEKGERYLTELGPSELINSDCMKESITTIMEQVNSCDGSNNFSPDYSGNLKRILFLINKYQKYDWYLDIDKDKITDEEKGFMKVQEFETDLDSLLIIIFGLSEDLKIRLINCKYGTSCFNIVQKRINSVLEKVSISKIANGLNAESFALSEEALKIVTYFESWMSPSELNSKSITCDTSKMYQQDECFKKPTIGLFYTKYGDVSDLNILSLPTTRSSGSEPIFAWLYGKSINKKIVSECLKDVAISLLMVLKPSNYLTTITNIVLKIPTYSNLATEVPGGCWLARCSYILYCLKTEKNSVHYVEETYNGKARTSNSFEEFTEFFQSSNFKRDEFAAKAANHILEESNNSHTGSIFRLFDSNLFDCELILGVGVQFDGSLHEKNTYICIPPPNIIDEKKKIDYYTYGNLPKSIAANTVEEKSISSRIGVKRVSNANSNTNNPISVRNQFYSKAYRYPVGEYGVKNKEEKMSHRIKLESASLETADYFSPNFMLDTVGTYTSLGVSNYCNISESAGFRNESAYVVSHLNNNKSEMIYSSTLSSDCRDVLKVAITTTLNHILDNCAVFDLQLISNYSSMQQSLFIVLYKASIKALKLDNNSFERLAILVYMKRVGNYLSRFYNGRDVNISKIKKNIRAEKKEIIIAIQLGRTLLLTIPSRVYECIISIYGNNSIDDNMNVKEFLKGQHETFYPSSIGYRQAAEIRNDLYFNKIRSKGRDIGVVVICSGCGKYFRNQNILHLTHLSTNTICRAAYSDSNKKKRLEAADVIDYTNQVLAPFQIDENGEEEKDIGLIAMEQILEGKSIFVQGRAGTGKSYLIQMILELVYIYLQPSEVMVLGPTGLACHNIGEECITFQKAFGCQGPIISFDVDVEFRMIIDRNDVMSKMKSTRFIIIDEIGYVHMHFMIILDKVLREAKEKEDIPFGGVQILVSGQVVQLGPIFSKDFNHSRYGHLKHSGAKSCGLIDLCVPIHLQKIRRNSGDKDFMCLSDKAHLGKLTLDDYEKISQSSGDRIKRFSKDLNLLDPRAIDKLTMEKYNTVIHLTHTWKQLFTYTTQMFKDIDSIERRGNIKTHTIVCPHYKSNGDIENHIECEEDTGDTWKRIKSIYKMRMYLGCPMMIMKNFTNNSFDGCGKNGVRAIWKGVCDLKNDTNYLTDYDLSLNENGKSVIERISDNIENYALLFDVEVLVIGKKMIKKNVQFKHMITEKVHMKKGITRKRYHYPFLYGHAVTSHKTQGMTLDLLSTNINYFYPNRYQITSGEQVHGLDQSESLGLFYVMFTRVKNLSSILIENMSSANKNLALDFLNGQDVDGLAWEDDWNLRAQDIKFNLSLKYLDKTSLYNQLGIIYQEGENAQTLRIMHLQELAGAIAKKTIEMIRVQQLNINTDMLALSIVTMIKNYEG